MRVYGSLTIDGAGPSHLVFARACSAVHSWASALLPAHARQAPPDGGDPGVTSRPQGSPLGMRFSPAMRVGDGALQARGAAARTARRVQPRSRVLVASGPGARSRRAVPARAVAAPATH